MKILTTVLLALAITSPLAQEVEQRMDVKGMRLGDTQAQMQAAAKLTCGVDRAGEFDTVCRYTSTADRTFAGQRATSIVFGLFGGKLDSVQIKFDSAAYGPVRIAMDSKFGEVTPSQGLNALRTYMMNGDRAYLMMVEGPTTLVLFQAAAGNDERARRIDAAKAAVRKDM